MKKSILAISFMLLVSSLFAAPTWDVLDKSMADYAADGGTTSPPWGKVGHSTSVLTQKDGYFNFSKPNAGGAGYWSWAKPTTVLPNLTSGTAYSLEIKARINPLGTGTALEANQVALRLGSIKAAAPIFLKYGDGVTGGSVSTTPGGEKTYKLNTSEWQIYRLVFHADHSKYDVYVVGNEEPIFENVPNATTSDANGVYFGGESAHRCNIDVEYVKMGTGDFFTNPRISTVELSQDNQIGGTEATVSVTAKTFFFDNGQVLLYSLIDHQNNEVVAPVEAVVANNSATGNLVIPASVSYGLYYVKIAAKNKIGDVEVSPKTSFYEIKDPVAAQTWNVLDRNFAARAWDAAPAWAMEKGGSVPVSFVTQKDGYVNLYKMQAYGSSYYGFITSPQVSITPNTAYTYEVKARVHAIDKTLYPDKMKPTSSGEGGYEANQIGFLLNNKHISLYLLHGDENTGYLACPRADGTGVSPSTTFTYKLNTSEWHVYRLIYNADNTRFDIYIDGELAFENLPLFNKTGNNVAKIGGESWQRCNMDIEYVRIGTGDLVNGEKPQLSSIGLSSDSHVANNARTIQVTANTAFIADGEKLVVSMTNESNVEVVAPVELTINSNTATVNYTIPASVALGKYKITIAAPNGKVGNEVLKSKSIQYVVADVSPIDSKILPQVEPVDFVKAKEDYIYKGPTGEFIFPSIVDTKKYTVDGKFKSGAAPIDRYYLYYAPHDNPGGIYLSTAPTMDGPWTEYAGSTGMTAGTVMDFAWASMQSEIIMNGAERHISACQVVWNEEQNKFIMYFHGPNTTTHYATSDNMVDWTFGESIIVAHQFSPIGAEASYAKVFEHTIPGLNNKYVMLLMNQENQIRRIYWAHSNDGINWIPVTKPLISPDLNYKKIPGTDTKPNYHGGGTGAYGNNVSGPFLMEVNGRYFVYCHGPNNIAVVEVGEGFDMEVHWGNYITSKEVVFNVEGVPTETRPAAPDFLQDDEGRWYMFFEAGGRLSANIGYAKESKSPTSIQDEATVGSVSISKNLLKVGDALSVSVSDDASLSEVSLFGIAGNEINRKAVEGSEYTFNVPVTPGLYVLVAKLDNKLAKEFKILVK